MRSFFITGLIALLISPLVADDFSDQIKPILEKHCISCHGPKKQKGGITLHDIDSLDAGFKKFQLLENVIDQVEYEEMPPEDEDVLPTDAERKALIKALSKVVDRVKSGNIPQRAGRVTLRRLNRNEYHYTVRDLFGVTFNPSKDFPVDGAGGEGFDNMADALFSTPTLLEKYLAAAKKVVSAVYANPALKGKVIFATPESPKESKATAEKVLTYHATLAYRRRVNKDDLSPLLKAFAKGQQAGKNFEQSLRAPLTALPINPRFLFRAEHDEAGKDEWPLNDFELATRLSYFLWSSMPDRALFKIADAGQLRDPKVLRAQQPPFTPSAPVQRRLQGPPAKSKFLAVPLRRTWRSTWRWRRRSSTAASPPSLLRCTISSCTSLETSGSRPKGEWAGIPCPRPTSKPPGSKRKRRSQRSSRTPPTRSRS
ncbi:DUF1587 domain-containing protein [bacterium]|nr:DUF1587 domain-containing protein [bacterium]